MERHLTRHQDHGENSSKAVRITDDTKHKFANLLLTNDSVSRYQQKAVYSRPTNNVESIPTSIPFRELGDNLDEASVLSNKIIQLYGEAIHDERRKNEFFQKRLKNARHFEDKRLRNTETLLEEKLAHLTNPKNFFSEIEEDIDSQQQRADAHMSKKLIQRFYDTQLAGHRDMLVHGYGRRKYISAAQPSRESTTRTAIESHLDGEIDHDSADEACENEAEGPVRDHFNYYNKDANILVRTERIMRKKFALARLRLQRALVGGNKQSSSKCAVRNKIHDVPEILQTSAWDNIEKVDVDSVRNEGEQLTNVAMFNILHHLVGTFNDERNMNEISITDFSFVDAVRASASEEERDVDPAHYQCFKDVDNARVLIPVLLTDGNQGHYILIETIIMAAKGASKINVFDPLFNGQAAISSEQVKMLVNAIGNPRFQAIEPRYARRSEIVNQNDVHSCGLHLLQNVQAILANPKRVGTNLMKSYPQEVRLHTLKEQRKSLAKILESKLVVREPSQAGSVKRFRAKPDVFEMMDATNLSTATSVHIAPEVNECVCTILTPNAKESLPRSEKVAVLSKCTGTLTSLGSLVDKHPKEAFGAENTADLVISRVRGECDIDWSNDEMRKNWSKIGICQGHLLEFGTGYLDKSSKTYSHGYFTKKGFFAHNRCAWPDNAIEPHSQERPLASCNIVKEQTKHLLDSQGFLLPPGSYVCKFHKDLVNELISTSCTYQNSSQHVTQVSGVSPSLNRAKTEVKARLGSIEKTPKSTSLDTETTPSKKRQSENFLTSVLKKQSLQKSASKDPHSAAGAVRALLNNLQTLVDDDFKKVVKQIEEQLTANIVRLKDETEGHYAMRLLGHVNFHLCKVGDDSDRATNILDVYPMQHRKFMGLNESETNQQIGSSLSSSSSSSSSLSASSLSSSCDEKDSLVSSEETEMIDQFVPGNRNDAVVKPPKKVKQILKDKNVERALEKDLVDIYGPELEQAHQDTRDVAKKITKARLCDSLCPIVDEAEAANVFLKLLGFTKTDHIDRQCSVLDVLLKDTIAAGITLKQWVIKHQVCYQGLRSLNKRFVELERLNAIRRHITGAGLSPDASVTAVEILNSLPDHLQKKFNRLYAEKKCVKHHTQSAVREMYGELEEAFNLKLQDLEDRTCNICTRYTVKSEIYRKKGDEIDEKFLLPEMIGALHYDVCRMCWREMKFDKIPHGALVNGMAMDDTPDVLKKLNPIERMLIQRVRAIQNIFHLRDIGGRKTAMKGTKGVLVLVPVAVRETTDHVAAVLPSASEMSIIVKTTWDKVYLVSMSNIIQALNWLKSNNPHYADITINEKFNFVVGKEIVFEQENVSDIDASSLILRHNQVDDGHLLTQADFETQPMRPVNPTANDSKLALERFLMKKDKYRPLSVDEPNIDEKVLPALHPKGRYGFSHPRERATTLIKYTRHRILQKDRRFARNPNWYAMMFGLKSQKAITSTLGVQARVRKGAVKADVRLEDPAFTSSLTSIMGKVRGTPAYWKKCRLDVRSHVASFGNPTFFLTLNSNEKNWKDLHELYSRITGREIDSENIQEEIAKDPAVYSRYWQRRLRAFFTTVILAPNGPLGKVTHYFWRVEYQHRGTQHVHCLLWTSKKPAADASTSEITDFVDKYITARLPSSTEEPELHAIIEGHQKHWAKHSKTCLRITKYRGKIMKRCRFDFPRPELRRTTYYKEKCATTLPGLDKREYYVARDENARMINDYNPAISLIWNANTDVQIISANSVGVCNYVSAYATKGEKAKKATDGVMLNVPSTSSMSTEMFKTMVNFANNREVGSLELMDDLLGHPNFEFDRGHTFIPNDQSDKRVRTLKPAEVLKSLDKDESVYKENYVDQYYPMRGPSLRKFSLFNLMINFDVCRSYRAKKAIVGKKQNVILDPDEDDEDVKGLEETGTLDEDYHYADKLSPFYIHDYLEAGDAVAIPGTETKVFRKRRQTIPRFFLQELDWNDDVVVEDFFRRLCLMFIAWDDEEKILEDCEKDSYLEVFSKYQETLAQKSPNAAQDLHKIVSNFINLKVIDRQISERLDAMKKAMVDLEIDQDLNEEIEIQKREVNAEKHDAAKNGMNKLQKEIFDEIISTISKQDDEMNDEAEGIRLFISGTAGVGKSFLINCLADEVTLKYTDRVNQGLRPSVLIAAPTGLAAIGVKGSTMHTLFNIEVQHGKDSPFAAMRDAAKDMKRALFSNVRLIIIDELSMCSSITLLKMHLRLQEIFGNAGIFGNTNIVMFGDLLQLQPVLAPRVFQGVNAYQMRHIFGSVCTSANLWNALTFKELTENMRQRKDLAFADLMGRVRLQSLGTADIELLSSRIITIETGRSRATYDEMAEFFVELQKKDPGALALFATNAETGEFNGKVMELRKMEVTRIRATETAVASVEERTRTHKSKTQRIWQRKAYSLLGKLKKRNDASEVQPTSDSPNIAGGLPLILDVAINARVMLRRNLDTPNGLVNGATGTLTAIERDANNHVTTLTIRFDNGIIKNLERMSVYYDCGFEERRCRNQFPIVMAFGATVHKAQGLTLDNVLVSTRNMFCAGQFFVAASRVKNIDGLHLADLHTEKILVDTPSLTEYNRLRSLIGLESFPLPLASSKKKDQTGRTETGGNLVVVVENADRRRKVRTFVDNDGLTSAEIEKSIPILMETKEFVGSEKQMVHGVLLCITMMSTVRRGLINIKDDSHITFLQLTLGSLMEGGSQCADYLMRNIRKELVNPTLMFEKCFEFLPEELRKVAQWKLERIDKCLQCHHRNEVKRNMHVIEIFDQSDGCIDKLIDEQFDNSMLLEDVCNKCQKRKVLRTQRVKSDPLSIQYAIVVLRARKNRFDRLKQDGSHFLNKRWQCIAVVQSIGSQEQKTTLCRPDGGYLLVTENEITTVKSRPPFVNVHILVFKVKPYERTSKKQAPVDNKFIDEVPVVYPMIEDDSDDDEEVELKAPNIRNKNSILNDSDDSAAGEDQFKLLKLANTGTDCFVTSSLNLLHSMSRFRQDIATLENPIGMMKEIQAVFQGIVKNSSLVRKEMDDRLQTDQHDVLDALENILNKVPTRLQESYSLVHKKVVRCSSGCGESVKEEDRSTFVWLHNNEHATSTISVVESADTKTTICKQCKGSAVQQVFCQPKPTTRNILVARPGPQYSCYILPDVDSTVALFGTNWRVKALVSYRPTDGASMGSSGHWVTWAKTGALWAEIDDSRISVKSTVSSVDLNYAVLYNLEEI